jgi:hypothetical protein
MPQNVNNKYHGHLTLAANDLCTVVFLGKSGSRNCVIKNSGPGIVWGSFDPGVAAAVGNASCFTLKSGESLNLIGVKDTTLTLNADTASTLCDVILTG